MHTKAGRAKKSDVSPPDDQVSVPGSDLDLDQGPGAPRWLLDYDLEHHARIFRLKPSIYQRIGYWLSGLFARTEHLWTLLCLAGGLFFLGLTLLIHPAGVGHFSPLASLSSLMPSRQSAVWPQIELQVAELSLSPDQRMTLTLVGLIRNPMDTVLYPPPMSIDLLNHRGAVVDSWMLAQQVALVPFETRAFEDSRGDIPSDARRVRVSYVVSSP